MMRLQFEANSWQTRLHSVLLVLVMVLTVHVLPEDVTDRCPRLKEWKGLHLEQDRLILTAGHWRDSLCIYFHIRLPMSIAYHRNGLNDEVDSCSKISTRVYDILVGASHLIGVSTTGNWTYSTVPPTWSYSVPLLFSPSVCSTMVQT